MKRFALFLAAGLLVACGDTATAPDVATGDLLVSAAAVDRGNSPNAKACQKDGWQGLVREDGTSFASEEECVSYAAEGGTLYRPQTITFDPLSGKTFGDADFSVSATASSGLAVTFSAGGNCTVAGSTVHLTGAGSCTITAHQAGDANWLAAPDVSRSFAIAKGDQTLAFTSTNPSPARVGGPTYTPAGTATSGLIVSFSLDAGSTGCSLTNGVVSFASAGTCIINADQAGDADWNPAPQQQQSIVVWTGKVFAIAYSDMDDTDGPGFKEGTDVLIARLFDANGDGVISAGDQVTTHKYPTAIHPGAANFGSFTTTTYTVTGILSPVYDWKVVVYVGSPDRYFWFQCNAESCGAEQTPTRNELFSEEVPGYYVWIEDVWDGLPDEIWVRNSQGDLVYIKDDAAGDMDSRFLDVEININGF